MLPLGRIDFVSVRFVSAAELHQASANFFDSVTHSRTNRGRELIENGDHGNFGTSTSFEGFSSGRFSRLCNQCCREERIRFVTPKSASKIAPSM